MAPPPHDPDSVASARMLHRHQELMRLCLVSTRRGNSVSSDASSLAARNDCIASHNDLAVLRQKFQFIRDDEADAQQGETDWQVRMSVRYYRKLFREYALADLCRYQEGKIGLRWRTEMEVIAGKGQFSCGNKRCDEKEGLRSYELLFAYVEHGERKRCLVKVRACSSCAEKLFYKKLMEVRRKKARRLEKKRRLEEEGGSGKQKAKRLRRSTSSSDSDNTSDNGAKSEVEGSADQDELTGEDIHELCGKINEQQKAAYPAGNARRRSSDERSHELDELLP
ncbi:hypothetical protein PRNP1_005395 [Phytophthora ramorum]